MIKIAIIGTGNMARLHMAALGKLPDCKVVAACDVSAASVGEFGSRYGIPNTFTELPGLFKSGGFDAVINATPDRFHSPVSLEALKNGRHVFCEKPLAVNHADAEEMARAAHAAGVIHMVNFTYRNSAALHKARELVHGGALGRILHVEAAYLQSWLAHDAWGHWPTSPAMLWRLSTAHGSRGVLGDIGVHLLDFASYPAGDIASVHCTLRTFSKAPGEKIGDYILDANDTAVITANFQNGALGILRTTRWASGHHNSVTLSIHGDEGALKIDLDRSESQLELCRVENRKSGPWTTVDCPATPTLHERFLAGIRSGINDQPDFDRGAAVQKVLDACEQSHIEGRTISVD